MTQTTTTTTNPALTARTNSGVAFTVCMSDYIPFEDGTYPRGRMTCTESVDHIS